MASPDKSARLDVRQLLDTSTVQRAAEPSLAPDEVAPGRSLLLHFSITLESGELIDSNFDAAPAQCSLGDGKLLPGFEEVLLGMRAGEEREVLLSPEQAFGPAREENIQHFPSFRFPADLPLERGLMLDFADAAGNSQPGVVLSFDSAQVSIDFNHPLAGRPLLFRVKVVQVGAESSADNEDER